MNNIINSQTKIVLEGESETIELSPFEVFDVKVNYLFNRIPFCEILLFNTQESVEFSSKEDFIPSKELKVLIVDEEEQSEVLFSGLIMNYGTVVKNGKYLTSIDLQSELVKLTRGTKNRVFPLNIMEIVNEVLSAHSITFTNNLTSSNESEESKLLQYHISDYDFLTSKVLEYGGVIYSRPEEIIVTEIDLSTAPTLTIHPYDCSFFDVSTSIRGVVEQLNQFTYKVEEMEIQEDESEMVDLELGSQAIFSSDIISVLDNDKNFEKSGYSIASPESLKQNITQKVILSKLSKVQGSITIAGNVNIHCGDFIEICEAGDAVNGKAFVYGVEHFIQGDKWVTNLDLGYKINERNLSNAQNDKLELLGVHHGIVKSVTANDSIADKYLIQVELPVLMQASEPSESEHLIWARLASFYAGRSHGTLWLPELEDEVIVTFMGGDSSNAVVLGSLFKNSDEHENVGVEGVKSIITNTGLLLKFDDTEEQLVLKTATSQILLDQRNGLLQTDIMDGDTILSSVTMDSEGGISLVSTDGEINIEADVINIRGNTGVNIEAASDMTVNSQAMAITSQANMDIEASAMMKLKGTQIQLN